MWMGRRRPLLHPIWYLRWRGYEHGFRDGRWVWRVIGVAAWSGYVYHRVMNPPAEVVFRTKLLPGESVAIATHEPARGRRRRRADAA